MIAHARSKLLRNGVPDSASRCVKRFDNGVGSLNLYCDSFLCPLLPARDKLWASSAMHMSPHQSEMSARVINWVLHKYTPGNPNSKSASASRSTFRPFPIILASIPANSR